MNKDTATHEYVEMPDNAFPIKIFYCGSDNGGKLFPNHWHEMIELLYFTSGSAMVYCDGSSIRAEAGDLIVINCNQLHSAECLTDVVKYNTIIMPQNMLKGYSTDICDTKYLEPIYRNHIVFQNHISNDKKVAACIKNIFKEYKRKDVAYELSIKSSIYSLMVALLRKYVSCIQTRQQYDWKLKNLQKFDIIFKYIDNNFAQPISSQELAAISNTSVFHFCRMFKKTTGKTLTDYVNEVRIDKAAFLLSTSSMNITEIGGACGFDDLNYFSRVFKKHKGMSPKAFRVYPSEKH